MMRLIATAGYGFVSFKDSEDFLKALKEMNGMLLDGQCALHIIVVQQVNTAATDR